MGPVRRALAIFATLIVTTALTACPAPQGPAVGLSDKPRTSPRPKATAPVVAAPPADLRAGVSAVPGRTPSLGHASGRWDYQLSANDAGRAALAGGDAAVGAKIVMDHFERAAGNERGPTMAMEKRPKGFDPEHGDWRWIVVGSSGTLLFDGKAERCWGCHTDAPRDHVFPRVE